MKLCGILWGFLRLFLEQNSALCMEQSHLCLHQKLISLPQTPQVSHQETFVLLRFLAHNIRLSITFKTSWTLLRQSSNSFTPRITCNISSSSNIRRSKQARKINKHKRCFLNQQRQIIGVDYLCNMIHVTTTCGTNHPVPGLGKTFLKNHQIAIKPFYDSLKTYFRWLGVN